MTDPTMESLLVELTEFMRSRFFGKYRGLVVDVQDLEKLGQIKAKVPEIYGDNESPWALPSIPFAGKNHGLMMLPEEGDGVWIECEAGDSARPIWTGFWFATGDMPEPAGPKIRAFVSAKGHKIIVDDEKEELKLVHGGGAEIAMTNDEITLKIGSSQIVLSARGVNINNGAMVIR
jgi:uncharacterized protein involved in type VI secretion and phage assembly